MWYDTFIYLQTIKIKLRFFNTDFIINYLQNNQFYFLLSENHENELKENYFWSLDHLKNFWKSIHTKDMTFIDFI